MVDLLLRNAVVQDRDSMVDVAVDGGIILAVALGLEMGARQEIDLGGRLLVPGFVEPHVHLDIALSNNWEHPGRPQPFISIPGLNQAVEQRRRAYTSEDIQQRAGKALELACRHGVTAVRAQCHVDTEIGLKHVEALQAVKEKYAGWVTLQIVAFPQQGLFRNPGTFDLVREAFRRGADVMGGAANLDAGVDFRTHLEAAFDLAMELDVDLDAHADLLIPQEVTLEELEVVHLARCTIERGYQGRVAAGHVCALDSALPEVAQQAIELIKEAEISVISQPDLYRLGRDDLRHKRRGLTRVKELLAAGVNVAYASNNVRDGYRPLGNFNPLEEALILAYGAHMDTIQELETLLRMGTYGGAKALRLPDYGLQAGCRADLVVLDAPSPSAAIVSQAEKNYVFKAGRLVARSRVVSEAINHR